MTRTLTFRAADRLLVFAPHPDDETLATGELIQLALAAGAEVRVVFATDGDNNPWPQRWAERRWRIGAAERERWGKRRRGEALAALARLGLSAQSARFLGWPDLGLTARLERDDTAIEALRAEIDAFAPTHVAMPSLHDRHPDHGALRVMLELALRRGQWPCLRLGYVVHGRSGEPGEWLPVPDAARHARKSEALMAHASQIILSRRRLLRWAGQRESFEHAEANPSIATVASGGILLSIPLVPRYRFWRRQEVLLVLADGERVTRACVRLPRLIGTSRRVLGDALCQGRATISLEHGALEIAVAAGADGSASGYVKLERSAPRVFIFDVETWRRFEDFAPRGESVAPRVEPVAIAQRASL